MEIHVVLSEDIINRSLKLHYAYAPLRQRYSVLFVPAALIFIAAYLMITEYGKTKMLAKTWPGLLYGVLAVLYFFYMKYRREHTGRQLMKSLGDNSSFLMTINGEELVTKLKDSDLNLSWSEFPKAILGDSLVLLYQPNQSFSMFHESFFEGSAFQDFRLLVRRQVKEIKETSNL